MHGKGPCWQCHHFDGWVIRQYTQERKLYAANSCKLRRHAQPEFGCVDWQREPGTDDEPHCIDPCGRRLEAGKL